MPNDAGGHQADVAARLEGVRGEGALGELEHAVVVELLARERRLVLAELGRERVVELPVEPGVVEIPVGGRAFEGRLEPPGQARVEGETGHEELEAADPELVGVDATGGRVQVDVRVTDLEVEAEARLEEVVGRPEDDAPVLDVLDGGFGRLGWLRALLGS